MKVKVKVATAFIDRHSFEVHEVGEVLEITDERYNEIMSVNPSLVEQVKEEKKTRKKKVEENNGTEI